MKFDSIVLVGPAYNLYPLVNEKFATAELPFLSIPLLIHTINYIGPFSAQIFVFCLESHKNDIYNLIKDFDYPIEVLARNSYEGFGYCMQIIRDIISKENLLFCRSDMYFIENFDFLINYYQHNEIDVLGSIYNELNDNHMMCITEDGILKAYNSDEIPFLENEELVVTKEYKMKNFFICKSALLKMVPNDAFSFKKNVIPFLIKNGRVIKLITTRDLMVNSVLSYRKQLEYKNKALGSETQNICCVNALIGENNNVEGSIIGNESTIGIMCRIKNSIIMDGVWIGERCVIHNCVIGKNCKIQKGSKLINCNVGPYFEFEKPIEAENKDFSNEF